MTSEHAPAQYVLFPGRHHLLTRYQIDYLTDLLAGHQTDTTGHPLHFTADAHVIWALTSATHSGTRRNPLPAHRREAMIEAVTTLAGVPSLTVPVADVPPSDHFAHTTLTTVAMTLAIHCDPTTTVVACSTPAVADMYAALGYRIAPVEAAHDPAPPRPWDVLELMVAADLAWRDLAHPHAAAYIDRYHLDHQVRAIHTDPTVGSEGDLTATRDYRTYTAAFDDASDRKWDQVAPHIVPGKVVDLGCAAGGLLERAARDPRLGESDLYGVDVSRYLVAEAEHRKAQGAFANPSIWFAQRNLLRAPVFPTASVNTTITCALTHEISSYGTGRADLELLARRIFDHTAPGGVWINSDVLGPDDADEVVQISFDGHDLTPEEVAAGGADMTGWTREQVQAHITALNPAQRLVQFARDFPALSGASFDVRWEGLSPQHVPQAELTRRDAFEYLYTRDYVDNWLSECHERFCDMTWADWVELVTTVGFEVDPASGPWRNDWLVANRLSADGTRVDHVPYREWTWPSTHLLLVARRPLALTS